MIQAENITKNFGDVKVLKNISLEIKKGEIISIVGPSGAGKTTLLQIMGTLENATTGSVFIDGTDVSNLPGDALAQFRNKKIGFVFQFHHLLPEFSALENVMLPALIAGSDHQEAKTKATSLLKMLSLSERVSHKPSQLSGGEAQRVAIARAIINSPSVLFADEPSGNLDTHSRDELHKIFFDLRDKLGITIVIVTHDTTLAELSDRKIEIIDGQIR